MIINDQDAQTLKQLGLSVSQSKVYLVLLLLGKTTGSTLWKSSGVARQDIYRILTELQEKGFVEKRADVRPTEFEAVPIEDVVSILLIQKSEEYQEVKKNTKNLIDKNRNNREAQLLEDVQFRFIVQKAQKPKRKKLIEDATERIDVVTTWERFLQATAINMDVLRCSLRRGVTHSWVVTNPNNKKEIPKSIQKYLKHPQCKIRFLAHFAPEVAFSLYDGTSVLIATNAKKPIYADSDILWSNSPSIGSIMQRYFSSLWDEALEDTSIVGT